MIYSYQCKQDSAKTWHYLSLTTKAPMLDSEMAPYVEQWALSKQVNPDTVAIRCIDQDGNCVYTRVSNATWNHLLKGNDNV